MSGNERLVETLQRIGMESTAALEKSHEVREADLANSRKAVQLSSRAIRAAHRGEFDAARELSDAAGQTLSRRGAGPNAAVSGGFRFDGEKEFVESALAIALLDGQPIPDPAELGVGYPAWLNGLAEAASELRRAALDAIRQGDAARADELLAIMDESLSILGTIDFPEGVTGGLRRRTDQLRGVVERTRGDVTHALRQTALEARMSSLESKLRHPD